MFPPNSWALAHADGCVIEHHRRIRDATTAPLMLYAAPVGAGAMAYAPSLLEQLVADRRLVAIKEGSWEVAAYEQNLRLIRKLRPEFIVLGSGDEHLMTSYPRWHGWQPGQPRLPSCRSSWSVCGLQPKPKTGSGLAP